MNTRWPWLLMALMTLCLAGMFGCQKAPTPPPEKPGPVDWPAAPANGAPVAVHFIEMIGEGAKRGANMRIFNFADAPMVRLDLTLVYLDKNDNELGTFPFAMQSPGFVAKKGQEVMPMGGMVPAETTRILARVR